MSVEFHAASEPSGNNETPQVATVGGNKPLHRFLRCQPKIIGTVVLIIGASALIITITIWTETFGRHMSMAIPPEFFLETLFIICGILYIVTEHHLSKKTVTISLALSIVSILDGFWTIFSLLAHFHFYYDYQFVDEYVNGTDIDMDIPVPSNIQGMGVTMEAVLIFYCFVGTIFLIVTSVLAGAALRSTNTQAIVVMTAKAAETPVE
ncbi:uncharacterized protein V3H82_014049 isoform 1-T2 [Fundulus diaphanus]